MIAFGWSLNLHDPTRKEDDCTYDDIDRNEEDPSTSPTLQTLQDPELENRGFNMFIDF